MKKPVILSLSDFHIEKKHDVNLEDAITKFCEELLNQIIDNRDWKPDFICISGDIAFSGDGKEFNKAKTIIEKISSVCDVSFDNIIMAPGNHDMTAKIKPEKIIDEENPLWKKYPDEKQAEIRKRRKDYECYIDSYLCELESFLKKPHPSLLKKGDAESLIVSAFKEYSSFRRCFISDKVKYHTSRALENTDIESILGYKCFEQERILFWELNNTWMSLPYDKNIHRTYNMKFGTSLVNEFRSDIEKLKKEGYFVVTLFHQPFHVLAHEEYQPSGGFFCAYDTIVKLSDICLSGHEHGPETKNPDCLGNSSQYFLNGGFYAWQEKRLDCSAALIRIDRENNTIQKKQMYYDVRDFCWKYPKFIEVPIASYYEKTKQLNKSNNNGFEYKKLKCQHDLNDESILHSKIQALYFGTDFILNGCEQNGCKVCFVNIQNVKVDTFEIARDGSSLMLLLCYAPEEMLSADEVYQDIKKKYEKDILQGNVLFVMTKIERY
ncbi:MAG: metallophosphoesterase [Bacteroidales bacterium]|jgi:predicted phosphodiesterase|nr:metallophosphoesterase [Bacteroidales bacterium]